MMTVFWHETKLQLRSLASWTISISVAVAALFLAVFPVFSDSIDSLMDMLRGFPPAFAAAFGLMNVDAFNFSWFYMFINTYISLFGAIMASGFAITVFAREKRSKSVDFLLTKPLSRQSIFAQKLLAVFAALVLFNLVYIAVCAAMYLSSGQPRENLPDLLLAAASLFFTQLVFMAVGVLVAIVSKKIRSVSGTASAIGFAGFILSVMHNIIGDDALLYIAPMKYFDPTRIFQSDGYTPRLVLTAAVVSVACLSAAYLHFTKSDAHAV